MCNKWVPCQNGQNFNNVRYDDEFVEMCSGSVALIKNSTTSGSISKLRRMKYFLQLHKICRNALNSLMPSDAEGLYVLVNQMFVFFFKQRPDLCHCLNKLSAIVILKLPKQTILIFFKLTHCLSSKCTCIWHPKNIENMLILIIIMISCESHRWVVLEDRCVQRSCVGFAVPCGWVIMSGSVIGLIVFRNIDALINVTESCGPFY